MKMYGMNTVEGILNQTLRATVKALLAGSMKDSASEVVKAVEAGLQSSGFGKLELGSREFAVKVFQSADSEIRYPDMVSGKVDFIPYEVPKKKGRQPKSALLAATSTEVEEDTDNQDDTPELIETEEPTNVEQIAPKTEPVKVGRKGKK